MEPILLPTKFEITAGAKPNEGILVLEPCYYGYGTTIGNALRRTLLSSLSGAAVTAVRIKGAQHEFSSLPNLKEDVLEIILNLKLLRLRLFTDEPTKLSLHVKGEKKVTAADFEKNSSLEVVNPELHLATLTDKKAELEMEITVERGRGYVPTEAREVRPQEIGTIMIDALFSPVRNVGYRVENVRVGEITNYDKLIMTIETDGTISPDEAVRASSQILLDYVSLFLGKKPAEEALLPAAESPSGAEVEEGALGEALPEMILPEMTGEEGVTETMEVEGTEGGEEKSKRRGRKPGVKKAAKKK